MGFPVAGLVTDKQIICSGTPSPVMILTVLRWSAVGSKVYPRFAAHIAEQRFCPCIPTAHRTSPNISSRAVR
jgi:hypothetical protein